MKTSWRCLNTGARAMVTALMASALPAAHAQHDVATPTNEPKAVQSDRQRSEFLTLLDRQRDALLPLAASDLARSFLNATQHLAAVDTRTIHRTKDRRLALSATEFVDVPEADRIDFAPRECDEEFFYCTGYGSPLLYARALDVASAHGFTTCSGKSILDFGYGMIGQGRLLAHCGANYVGVDVEPLLRALYSQKGDQGAVAGSGGAATGSLTLVHGRWPADAPVADAVQKAGGANGRFDLFISKNVLKAGYIHPSPPAGQSVDPRFLVQLGVSDEDFLRSVHDILNPGGLMVVYNISPAQNPSSPALPDKPYLPHADGGFPFDRAVVETCGFDVLAFDIDDAAEIRRHWLAAEIENGATDDSLKTSLFSWYTVLRKRQG